MPVKPVITLRCGQIDPLDLDAYLEAGGFKALKKVFDDMTPAEVVAVVKAAGLRGRGGAGFPCGLKWEAARQSADPTRYLIANADEGEVGAFKDRYLLTHDPLALIEGLAIAGYALEAARAFIYLRQEYRHLRPVLQGALDLARGRDLLDHLDIEIVEGAGAYVCGEESALMDSIEGRRGEPRYKPPFPVEMGLWGHPTVINNVETLMNIPVIIDRGPDWYAALGTAESKGTMLCCLSGDVPRPGVYELEMGATLEELVIDLGGAEDVKMVQVGGAGGRILPASELQQTLAFETGLGSGVVMVMNSTRGIIEVLARQVGFMAEESCGKCTPCREGTAVLVEIFGRLERLEGLPEDLIALERLAETMSLCSLCGLGQSVMVPVMDGLAHFRSEFELRLGQSLLLRRPAGPTGLPGAARSI
jgi:NADH:ubiquinone oxidoreductase subunit F (NADH-binding)